MDIPTFSSLLRYLYTEEVPSGGGGNEREHQHHHHHHGQHGGNGGQQSCGSGRGSGGGGSEGGHSGSYHALGTIVRPSKPLEVSVFEFFVYLRKFVKFKVTYTFCRDNEI